MIIGYCEYKHEHELLIIYKPEVAIGWIGHLGHHAPKHVEAMHIKYDCGFAVTKRTMV